MKYKVKLSVKIMLFSCLLLASVASATDSVTKTLYVDGQLVGTSTVNSALSYPYPRLTIGAEGSRYYPYNGLVGTIDEFAVYGGILTEAQILTHFNAAPATNYDEAVLSDSPVLYLRFEDATSNEFDKAANSGSGVDINSTYIGTVGLAAGYDGQAAVLSGTADINDCIDVCDWDAQLSFTDVSVEFWVKTTQNTDYPRFFQHNGDTAEQGSYGAMYVAETNAVGLIGGDATAYLNVVLNDNQWHHVVVTFNSLQPASYEAEVLADDPCVYLKFDNPMPADSGAFHYWVGYNYNNKYPGKIRPAPGAIGGRAFYCDNSFTGGADTRAYTWNEGGISGQGLTNWREFPGWTDLYGDQYLMTEPDYLLTPKASKDATYELWIKSTPELTPDQYCNVLQQIGGWQREPNAPFIGLTDGNNPALAQFRIGAGTQFWYTGVTGFLDGEWHHVVVTYDENEVDPGGSLGLQFFLDGSLRAITTIYDPVNKRAKQGNGFGTNPSGVFYTLMLGSSNNVGYGYSNFGGWLDEVAVYSGVLSSERVAMHYAAWLPKDCAEVWARGLGYEGDFDKDCDVDLTDYALFAQDWADCVSGYYPGCP